MDEGDRGVKSAPSRAPCCTQQGGRGGPYQRHVKRLRSQSLDTGAPLMPPPFVPTLWGDGGTSINNAGDNSMDSNSDSDEDFNKNGELQQVNVMNLLQSGGGPPTESRRLTQNYHNRKYE